LTCLSLLSILIKLSQGGNEVDLSKLNIVSTNQMCRVLDNVIKVIKHLRSQFA